MRHILAEHLIGTQAYANCISQRRRKKMRCRYVFERGRKNCPVQNLKTRFSILVSESQLYFCHILLFLENTLLQIVFFAAFHDK
jgi:hypothetical protein